MRLVPATVFALVAAWATVSPPTGSQAAALAPGLGTFISKATGRWLYFDTDSASIMFGSYTGAATAPATVFRLIRTPTPDTFHIQVTDNQRLVATTNGTGPATATMQNPGLYSGYNLSTNTDGTVYLKSWNGDVAKTMYGAMDSQQRLAFTVAPASAASAVKLTWVPNPYQSSGNITYRTLSAGSAATSLKYNVSTFYPKLNAQIYAYTVKWIGDLRQPNRPAMMYLGGSDSRSNQVLEETDVMAKTASTGFPKVVAFNSTIAQALLSNYLLIVPVSPSCTNTSTLSYIDNNCGISDRMHAIKHYRPQELKRIYDEVLATFGFDTTRFALVGTGMGGRGGLRFLLEYPTLPSAVSMVSGALETNTSKLIKALPYIPWGSGEGCWNVSIPNVGKLKCPSDQVVQPTMERGSQLSGFPIRLWSSRNDAIDTLAEAQETCRQVNSGSTQLCTVIDTNATDHAAMAYYSRDVSDVQWLASFRRLPGQVATFVNGSAIPPVVVPPSTTTTTSTSIATSTSTSTDAATTSTSTTPAPTTDTSSPSAPVTGTATTSSGTSSTTAPPPPGPTTDGAGASTPPQTARSGVEPGRRAIHGRYSYERRH